MVMENYNEDKKIVVDSFVFLVFITDVLMSLNV